MDWRLEHYRKKEHPEHCVRATTLRPLLYRTVLNLNCPLDTDYSERVYQFLKSSGRENPLSREELSQIQRVFNRMSDSILSSIQPHPDYDPD